MIITAVDEPFLAKVPLGDGSGELSNSRRMTPAWSREDGKWTTGPQLQMLLLYGRIIRADRDRSMTPERPIRDSTESTAGLQTRYHWL